jgi:hypothetical protein
MEFQMTQKMLWFGIISFYLALVLLLFRMCLTTFSINDAEKRAAHIDDVIQRFLIWIAGLMLILLVRRYF